MSKKLSFILAILLALIAIVMVSVFGQLPESLRPKVYMEELSFVDDRIVLNKSGDKIYYFKLTTTNLTINLDNMIKYKPNETTDISVLYLLDDTDIATVTSTGLLVFNESAIADFVKLEVTVTSRDGSNLKDKLIIQNENMKDSFEDSRPNHNFWS